MEGCDVAFTRQSYVFETTWGHGSCTREAVALSSCLCWSRNDSPSSVPVSPEKRKMQKDGHALSTTEPEKLGSRGAACALHSPFLSFQLTVVCYSIISVCDIYSRPSEMAYVFDELERAGNIKEINGKQRKGRNIFPTSQLERSFMLSSSFLLLFVCS